LKDNVSSFVKRTRLTVATNRAIFVYLKLKQHMLLPGARCWWADVD